MNWSHASTTTNATQHSDDTSGDESYYDSESTSVAFLQADAKKCDKSKPVQCKPKPKNVSFNANANVANNHHKQRKQKADRKRSGLPTASTKANQHNDSSEGSDPVKATTSTTALKNPYAKRRRETHLQRRALRQVNSVRTMLLSRRVSWKISNNAEKYSPMRAATLTFSPKSIAVKNPQVITTSKNTNTRRR